MARIADVGVCRSATASFASGLMEINLSAIKIFLKFLREVATERGSGVLGTKVWLTFVMFRYLMGGIYSNDM